MKKDIRYLFLFFLTFLQLACFHEEKKEDVILVDIQMQVSKVGKLKNNSYKITLEANHDRVLNFDGALFSAGCPYYRESTNLFKSKPNLAQFTHSQIVIENENHEFKVYSSGLLVDGRSIFTNCFEVDSITLELKAFCEESFVIGGMPDLFQINKNDKKIRLHLFYRDIKHKEQEFVVSSKNWIAIE
ncbi:MULTISPECIES: hypothetical protein [Sphingobacterium]|uniref:Lipoprotein n=1 Tax=Sphingobacterium populi TaxID=1812824 RepID=A0ABW5UHD0_9SPHI|nr:hypothetical protein [Sphingobacterium sp. CFCC 11742]